MASNDQAAIQNIGLPEDLLRAAKTDLPFAALLEAQSRIVDLMASDRDLYETLDGIAKLVEGLAPPAMCTILLMEPDGKHLRVGAAKSVPEAYNEACKNGIPVGDFQGSLRHRRLPPQGRDRRRYRDRSAVGRSAAPLRDRDGTASLLVDADPG